MENHGINMKGEYYMQAVSSPNAGSTRRLVYNTGTSLNGSGDVYGQNKMVYHNGTQWCRPLLAVCSGNQDGPRADNVHILGSALYRFAAVYATNFYGQVRYS